MTTHSPISLPLLISSNNRTSYDRHPLLWSAGMMARALIVRIYSLRLVWRRGGRWRALADCWQSERRDRPMSGRACYHGVTQQLLCCGQGLWSASGSGTVLCMGAKKTDPVYRGSKRRAEHDTSIGERSALRVFLEKLGRVPMILHSLPCLW